MSDNGDNEKDDPPRSGAEVYRSRFGFGFRLGPRMSEEEAERLIERLEEGQESDDDDPEQEVT